MNFFAPWADAIERDDEGAQQGEGDFHWGPFTGNSAPSLTQRPARRFPALSKTARRGVESENYNESQKRLEAALDVLRVISRIRSRLNVSTVKEATIVP